MEVGAVIGALIFFFIIVPNLFPQTYKKLNDRVTKWSEEDEAKREPKA